jgi:hypothetical protein
MKTQNKSTVLLADQICALEDKIKSLEKELSDQNLVHESLRISEHNLSAILEQNVDGIAF